MERSGAVRQIKQRHESFMIFCVRSNSTSVRSAIIEMIEFVDPKFDRACHAFMVPFILISFTEVQPRWFRRFTWQATQNPPKRVLCCLQFSEGESFVIEIA